MVRQNHWANANYNISRKYGTELDKSTYILSYQTVSAPVCDDLSLEDLKEASDSHFAWDSIMQH